MGQEYLNKFKELIIVNPFLSASGAVGSASHNFKFPSSILTRRKTFVCSFISVNQLVLFINTLMNIYMLQ